LIESLKKEAASAYKTITKKRGDIKRGEIKHYIASQLTKITDKSLDRTPLIVPVIVEV